MKKLPSYLKGLVESRARSAGDIQRLEQLRILLDEEIVAARKRLESADVLIHDFDPLLCPTQIQPVKSPRSRYGKVKEAALQVLLDAKPRALPTNEVAFLVAEKLEIRFHGGGDFRVWAKNGVHRVLRTLWETGVVERLPVPGEETRWRVAANAPATTLRELKALAD